MMISQRAKHILFFLAVALVYGVVAQEILYFHGDDIKIFFTQYNYPLPEFSGGHPHRLVDLFYQNIWSNFYFKYIQGVLIEPFFGQQHFLDTYRQMSLLTYGLGMAGFFFFSTLYVRVFVKLSFKQLAVFAALFYLFFIQYVNGHSINNMNARIFVFMAGLAFLYPIFVYVLARRNVFSEWDEYKSAALMVILSYLACFSYFHTMMFVAIGSLALAIIYCVENYERGDFSSITRFYHKIKAEPKWLRATIIFLPTFMLTSLFIAVSSERFLQFRRTSLDSDILFSLKEYRLDKALILLAVVFIIWAWNAYRNNRARIDKALYFRYGALVLSLLLLVLSFELLNYSRGRFIPTGLNYVRWIIVALALGYGFKIMKQGWAIVPMYFLFFILAAGGVRAIVSQKSDSNAYYHYNAMKVGINLHYTFFCYGKQSAPFYDKKYLKHRYRWLPNPNAVDRRQWRWYRMVARYARLPPSAEKKKYFNFYFEPSIAKINNQLKELRQTKPWQCARIENDIYRVDKLPY